jgi:hypothetical protein
MGLISRLLHGQAHLLVATYLQHMVLQTQAVLTWQACACHAVLLCRCQVFPRDVEAFRALPDGGASSFVAHVHGTPPTSLTQLQWSSPLSLRLEPATGEMITMAPISQVR